MRNLYRRCTGYVPGFLALILVICLIHSIGDGGFFRPKVSEAGSLQDTIGFDKSNPLFKAAMAIQKRHTDILLGEPGVVGTAVGLSAQDKPIILVLAKDLRSARFASIPFQLEGVPVIVKVTGEIRALRGNRLAKRATTTVDRTSRFERPVPIGVSTGHPDVTAGTIGARVTDGVNVYALSNNHVYADENQAIKGDNVLQPGTYDGGSNPADTIGTLYDFEPIDFSPDAGNTIDAAIALSSVETLSNATPSDGYGIPKSTTAAPALFRRVMKYGRTTGLTKGMIVGINATVNVGYNGGVARFVNQIIIGPGGFSAPGDSGSLVVMDSFFGKSPHKRKPVGLLFAGSSSITIANPIDAVLERFGVTIDGEGQETASTGSTTGGFGSLFGSHPLSSFFGRR